MHPGRLDSILVEVFQNRADQARGEPAIEVIWTLYPFPTGSRRKQGIGHNHKLGKWRAPADALILVGGNIHDTESINGDTGRVVNLALAPVRKRNRRFLQCLQPS